MKGQPTLGKAKELKETRELAAELSELRMSQVLCCSVTKRGFLQTMSKSTKQPVACRAQRVQAAGAWLNPSLTSTLAPTARRRSLQWRLSWTSLATRTVTSCVYVHGSCRYYIYKSPPTCETVHV